MGGARHGKVFGCYKEVLSWREVKPCEYDLQGGCLGQSHREKRASSWWGRWELYASLAFFLVTLCVFPSRALAYVDYNEMGISWGPNVVKIVENNVRQYGVVVVTDNIYNAALITLGYSPLDSRLTHDVMAKLSNASTGGAFYTFAQLVHKYYNGSVYDYPGWGNWGTFDVQANVYGKEYIYWVQYTQAQFASAKEDLEAILNGGNLGGGGSGGTVSGDYVLYDMTLTGWENYPESADFREYDGVALTSSIQSQIDEVLSEHSGYDYNLYLGAQDANYGSLGVIILVKPTNIIMNTNQYFEKLASDAFSGCAPGYHVYYQSANKYTKDGKTYLVVDTLSTVNGFNFVNLYAGYRLATRPVYSEWIYGDGTGGGPNVPDTNWPDSDPVEAPQPPEVPEPQEPEIDPQPDAPTPQPSPTFPIYVDVSTTTYTADLQGILDAMNDHCIHLQNALHTNFSDFWTSLSTKMTNDFATLRQYLHGQFSWLGETIQDEFSETRDYLKELFEWLADQFDYSISGGAYNDNTVVSWLKKIYSKLGTGTSSKPVDPVADPDQTGSWLDTLINNLLTALEDLFPGLIGQVADFFGGALGNLTQKFPFSIPWDIAAILGMLVAEPVAPSVEIPAYTLTAEGLTQAGSYDIDLSAYDAAWGAVRIMMRIAFALYVCVHTKDFLEVIERVMM